LSVGRLRPDIVLYGEEHPQAHLVGPLITHDLALGPDVLLILGTSMRVHGLKVMVREFAKAVHGRGGKVVFVNRTKPPESVWAEVIDWWVEWDCDAWVEDLKARREEIWTGKVPESPGSKLSPAREKVEKEGKAEKAAKLDKEKRQSTAKNPQAHRMDHHNAAYLIDKILRDLRLVTGREVDAEREAFIARLNNPPTAAAPTASHPSEGKQQTNERKRKRVSEAAQTPAKTPCPKPKKSAQLPPTPPDSDAPSTKSEPKHKKLHVFKDAAAEIATPEAQLQKEMELHTAKPTPKPAQAPLTPPNSQQSTEKQRKKRPSRPMAHRDDKTCGAYYTHNVLTQLRTFRASDGTSLANQPSPMSVSSLLADASPPIDRGLPMKTPQKYSQHHPTPSLPPTKPAEVSSILSNFKTLNAAEADMLTQLLVSMKPNPRQPLGHLSLNMHLHAREPWASPSPAYGPGHGQGNTRWLSQLHSQKEPQGWLSKPAKRRKMDQGAELPSPPTSDVPYQGSDMRLPSSDSGDGPLTPKSRRIKRLGSLQAILSSPPRAGWE
jgi:hypothetical protein